MEQVACRHACLAYSYLGACSYMSASQCQLARYVRSGVPATLSHLTPCTAACMRQAYLGSSSGEDDDEADPNAAPVPIEQPSQQANGADDSGALRRLARGAAAQNPARRGGGKTWGALTDEDGLGTAEAQDGGNANGNVASQVTLAARWMTVQRSMLPSGCWLGLCWHWIFVLKMPGLLTLTQFNACLCPCPSWTRASDARAHFCFCLVSSQSVDIWISDFYNSSGHGFGTDK